MVHVDLSLIIAPSFGCTYLLEHVFPPSKPNQSASVGRISKQRIDTTWPLPICADVVYGRSLFDHRSTLWMLFLPDHSSAPYVSSIETQPECECGAWRQAAHSHWVIGHCLCGAATKSHHTGGILPRSLCHFSVLHKCKAEDFSFAFGDFSDRGKKLLRSRHWSIITDQIKYRQVPLTIPLLSLPSYSNGFESINLILSKTMFSFSLLPSQLLLVLVGDRTLEREIEKKDSALGISKPCFCLTL
jgi:hypothetical protein